MKKVLLKKIGHKEDWKWKCNRFGFWSCQSYWSRYQTSADIDRAHCVGRMRDTNGANHGLEVIVKFNNSDARLHVLKGRSKLRAQRAKIFISEDLTKVRKTLAYECRHLKNRDCSSIHGNTLGMFMYKLSMVRNGRSLDCRYWPYQRKCNPTFHFYSISQCIRVFFSISHDYHYLFLFVCISTGEHVIILVNCLSIHEPSSFFNW